MGGGVDAMINDFYQLFDFCTRIRDRLQDHVHTLDLTLASILSSFSSIILLSSLGQADHYFLQFSTIFLNLPQYPTPDAPFDTTTLSIGIFFVNPWLVILGTTVTLYLRFLSVSNLT